ncbi:Glycerol-1-phosphate dehydrogenase [NAD(P)+] [compost metagenome]
MEYLRRGDRALLHGAKVGVACAEISRLYHDAIERGDFPNAKPEQWDQYHEQIAAWLTNVPTDANIRGLLKQAGGPSTLKDLGIDDDLFRQSLKEAHQVRLNRHTLLRALNEA